MRRDEAKDRRMIELLLHGGRMREAATAGTPYTLTPDAAAVLADAIDDALATRATLTAVQAPPAREAAPARRQRGRAAWERAIERSNAA